eukprot:TRINITY_DN5537_c0_g1_i1.p1 TRINITY_DN5537_c0_g1~~TRINITY_DN5537_c0_g1_i1.p1  ORF type:complete len:133 (-),score=7.81 TRINITY_DN5537_c0_g1_i1:180-578(-)
MEHDDFDYDIVPGDIWRLILQRLETLADLRSFNLVNNSWHNYCKYYMQKEKIWLESLKSRFGMDHTNIFSLILPSELFQLKQMLHPPHNIISKDIEVNCRRKIIVIGDGKANFYLLTITRWARSGQLKRILI